ncbi:DUF3306 domain-containing protein [Arenibaculum pallidiluteum]|uniref:DUF3306 domain-containing protein n=1 Tax=Arenibaculum pallidiluteum TaxID=2812559 RepID=UPI001A956F57|nr:DUF3306 domain-containing protein [Arenibaculum pallidiluteum]
MSEKGGGDGEGTGFLGRWSRLKRAARHEGEQSAGRDAPPGADAAGAAGAAPDAAGVLPGAGRPPGCVAEEGFDLSSLPSIDSLGPGSDFSLFMRAGVPADLRSQALRKLWVTDPDIRNYKTLADYDWDYNAPGYGQLLPIDDAKRYLTRILGTQVEEGQGEQAADPAMQDTAGAAAADEEVAAEQTIGDQATPGYATGKEATAEQGTGEEATPVPARDAQVRADGTAPEAPVAVTMTPVDAEPPADRMPATEPPSAPERRRRRHGGAMPS